jgi:hypothetical protein
MPSNRACRVNGNTDEGHVGAVALIRFFRTICEGGCTARYREINRIRTESPPGVGVM